MKIRFVGGTPPPGPGAPSTPEEAYKLAGVEAVYSDYVGSTRTAGDLGSLATWSGAVTANGAALVTTTQSDMDFPGGVELSGSANLTNCRFPYLVCTGGTSILTFCDIGDPVNGVNYPSGTGGVSTGNPVAYGSPALVTVQGASNLTVTNSKLECGMDTFRGHGNATSVLNIDMCWLNGFLKLARDPFQDGSGGSSVTFPAGIRVASGSALGTDITLQNSRVDWSMGLWLPLGEASRVGTPNTYNHVSGTFTPGTWHDVADVVGSASMVGEQTYSPSASTNVALSAYMMTGVAGALRASAGTVGATSITGNHLYGYCDSWVNATSATKESSVDVTNNVINYTTGFSTIFPGDKYTRLNVGSSVSSWTGNVDQDGATVNTTS